MINEIATIAAVFGAITNGAQAYEALSPYLQDNTPQAYYKVCNKYKCSTSEDNVLAGKAEFYDVTIYQCNGSDCEVIEKPLPYCKNVPLTLDWVNAKGEKGYAYAENCK